jgi:peptidoglycan/xylan/chitin deacetylase (PgdA/CDA1 family)
VVKGKRPSVSELTIVMYHYVRDLRRSRFPGIKGLTIEQFRGQLQFLGKDHRFVGMDEVLAAMRNEAELPPRAVLLTFDDGYSDHYRYVFPILESMGIGGCFFPPLRPLRDRVVLDVNKIHFSLAACGTADPIVECCLKRITELRDAFDLKEPEHYVRELMHPSRLDDAQTMFVKRLLQRALPEEVRSRITDEVFQRFVTTEETAFAEELYLTMDQIRTMRRAGMHFGSHGDTHRWLDHLTADEQREELVRSGAFLVDLGYERSQWAIAYPFGALNETTLILAAEVGYGLGFTTEARKATVAREDPLRLPRLDTVDLPFDPAA